MLKTDLSGVERSIKANNFPIVNGHLGQVVMTDGQIRRRQGDKYGEHNSQNILFAPSTALVSLPTHENKISRFLWFQWFQDLPNVSCPHKQKHLAAAVDILLRYTLPSKFSINTPDSQKYAPKQIHNENLIHLTPTKYTFLETYCHVSWLKLIVSVVFARRFLAGRRCVWGPFVPRYVWTPSTPHPALPNVWTPNSPSSVAA